MVLCRRCGQAKPVSDFARDASKACGRKSLCKTCDNAKSRDYYERNRERLLAYQLEWRAANRKPKKARQRAAAKDYVCRWCGTPFQETHRRERKYCSCQCANTANQTEGKSCPVPTCSDCGTVISRRKRICTACKKTRAQRRPKPPRVARIATCHGCAATFSAYHAATKYCTPDCARRHYKAERKHRLRAKHPSRERVIFAHICERDKWTCQICGTKVDRTAKVPHPKAPTRDHIIPLSQGGLHTPSNVQLAHFICNSTRGNRGGNEQLRLAA